MATTSASAQRCSSIRLLNFSTSTAIFCCPSSLVCCSRSISSLTDLLRSSSSRRGRLISMYCSTSAMLRSALRTSGRASPDPGRPFRPSSAPCLRISSERFWIGFLQALGFALLGDQVGDHFLGQNLLIGGTLFKSDPERASVPGGRRSGAGGDIACASGSGASGGALPVGESSSEIVAGVSALARTVVIAARLGAVPRQLFRSTSAQFVHDRP